MERKGMGILGSVLGGMLGALPMVMVGLLGFFTGWLGVFIAVGAFEGYKKFQGPKSIQFIKGTIIVVTISVTTVLSVVFGIIYTEIGGAWVNYSMLMMIPLFAGFVGYSLIDNKVQLYVNPNIMKDALEKAREENAENPDYGLYLPPMIWRKTRIVTNIFMLLPLVLIALLSYLGYLYSNINCLKAIPFALLGWSISVIAIQVSSGTLRLYAYAKTSENKIYKINLQKLNQDLRYRFNLSSSLMGFNIKRVREEEQEILRASVYRAITNFDAQQDLTDKSIAKLGIVELRDLQFIKDLKNTYRISYKKPNGRIKKDHIAKIYETFAPFPYLPTENKKFSVDGKAIVTSFICTILPFMAAFMLLNITSDVKSLPVSATTSKPNDGMYANSKLNSYEYKNISFKIPDTHIKIDENTFMSDDSGEVYGINAVAPMGSTSPQDAYDFLVSQYRESDQVLEVSSTLSPWTSSDKVSCYVGTVILLGEDNLTTFIDIIFAPDKNVAISLFCSSYRFTSLQLENLKDTLTFNIGEKNFVFGNTFINTIDQSELVLSDDGSFKYYESQEDHENNYYLGNYEVYYGQEAFDFIAEQKEYGITMEELENSLRINMAGYILDSTSVYMLSQIEFDEDGNFAGINPDIERYQVCKDTYYALVLKHQKLITSPTEEQNIENSKVLYLGYYIPEVDSIELLNTNELIQSVWTNKGKSK